MNKDNAMMIRGLDKKVEVKEREKKEKDRRAKVCAGAASWGSCYQRSVQWLRMVGGRERERVSEGGKGCALDVLPLLCAWVRIDALPWRGISFLFVFSSF